jgi:hypothetical protein
LPLVKRNRWLEDVSASHNSRSNAFDSQFVRVISYATQRPSGEIRGELALRISSDWSIVGAPGTAATDEAAGVGCCAAALNAKIIAAHDANEM